MVDTQVLESCAFTTLGVAWPNGPTPDGLMNGFAASIGARNRRDMNTLNLTIRPEFFRLPRTGVDPYFGLSRAFYYQLDSTGQVLLVHLRKRGSQKGCNARQLRSAECLSSQSGRSLGWYQCNRTRNATDRPHLGRRQRLQARATLPYGGRIDAKAHSIATP
jgi:hypothetical protein